MEELLPLICNPNPHFWRSVVTNTTAGLCDRCWRCSYWDISKLYESQTWVNFSCTEDDREVCSTSYVFNCTVNTLPKSLTHSQG